MRLDSYFGPLTFYRYSTTAAKWFVDVSGLAVDAPIDSELVALSSTSLQRDHTTIIWIEGA